MVTKHSKRASKELEAKLSSKGVALLSSSSTYLELRQYKNGLASVKKHVCFEIAALFLSPKRQGKKGGNFKISMRFTETSPFL